MSSVRSPVVTDWATIPSAAIETALILRLVFRLPLRQAERTPAVGFVFDGLVGLEAPALRCKHPHPSHPASDYGVGESGACLQSSSVSP